MRNSVVRAVSLRQLEEFVRSGIIVAMGLSVLGSGLVVLAYG
jgi:hypothetical protein